MTLLYVTEYRRQATDSEGNLLSAGEEPALAVQVKTFTSSAAIDNAFNKATTFVRIFTDGDACIAFGASPTATNQQDTPVNAEVPEFFGVNQSLVTSSAGLKVAAVDRTV